MPHRLPPGRLPRVLFPRGHQGGVAGRSRVRRIALVCGVPMLAVAAVWLAGFLWLHLPANLFGQ